MATFTAAEQRAYAKGCAKGEANLAEAVNEATMLSERLTNAEAERDDYAKQLETANDTIDDLRTELDANMNANLVEQTWLRMELHKAKGNRDFWIDEAVKWSTMFAEQRRRVEKYQAQMTIWVDNMKEFGRTGFLIDILFMLVFFLTMTGLTEPVLDWNWPWQ